MYMAGDPVAAPQLIEIENTVEPVHTKFGGRPGAVYKRVVNKKQK
jgi:hypothetical protein